VRRSAGLPSSRAAEIDFVKRHGADKVAHGDDITTDEHGNDTCLSCAVASP